MPYAPHLKRCPKYIPGGLGGSGYGSSAGAAASTLLTDISAFWQLDEESGARVDATGNGYDLVDVNTVGFTTGVIGNAARIVRANSEVLQGTTAADPTGGLRPAGFPTFACWFKLQGVYTGGNRFGYNRWGTFGTHGTYQHTTNRLECACLDSDGTASSVQLNNARATYPNLDQDVWHFFCWWVNDTTRKTEFEVNNDGTIRTSGTALNSGGMASHPTAKEGAFNLGGGSTNLYDGDLDLFGAWNRNLTAAERTELYNGGSGLAYPF